MVIAVFAIAAALRLEVATAGCQKDIDCKGTRICEQHECVFPRATPRNQMLLPSNAPAPSTTVLPVAPASTPDEDMSDAQVAARRAGPRKVSPATCAPLGTAIVAGRAEVLAAPDSTAAWVATIPEAMPACAGTERQGFGFRVVQLANGTTGFVKDASISDLVLPPPRVRPVVARIASPAEVASAPPALVPAKFAATTCAPLVPAIANEGAAIREGPDSLTRIIVTLRSATPVCAAIESAGFGFRRVRFADATRGFINESDLSE